MSINEIRQIIRASAWTRNNFSGINSEFVNQSVGPTLEAKIVELKALQIPARFAADVQARNTEMRACTNMIARWEAARAAAGVVT
jgi:hypothetical protein